MQLHQVRPTHKLKKKKPKVGRGGKRGTYSGKGQKGQKAHAGRKIRPAARDLILRLPKLKGVKNKSVKPKALVINIGNLNKLKGNEVNLKSLTEAGFISSSHLRKFKKVKLLGEGELKRAFFVSGLLVSKKARDKIKKAKGNVS